MYVKVYAYGPLRICVYNDRITMINSIKKFKVMRSLSARIFGGKQVLLNLKWITTRWILYPYITNCVHNFVQHTLWTDFDLADSFSVFLGDCFYFLFYSVLNLPQNRWIVISSNLGLLKTKVSYSSHGVNFCFSICLPHGWRKVPSQMVGRVSCTPLVWFITFAVWLWNIETDARHRFMLQC